MKTWDHLGYLSPVHEGPESGVLYKREDMFAPLGYGGINGSKLRQLVHLIGNAVEAGPPKGVITAASVRSPQISMGALVARHYGLPITVVLGATKPETAIKHENVAIAAKVGAEFRYTPVGFNPQLQRACSELQEAEYPDHYRLCYGITTPGGAANEDVAAFHDVGARQVANIPADVRTLVITAGSCNSVVSVLYGLVREQVPVSRVVLLGIGPTRIDWIKARLAAIEWATGLDLQQFTWHCHDHPEKNTGVGPILLEHFDLHATKWVSYDKRMRWSQDGIDFHPTYEGKAMTWLNAYTPPWWKPGTLFWIVGSEPSAKAMGL